KRCPRFQSVQTCARAGRDAETVSSTSAECPITAAHWRKGSDVVDCRASNLSLRRRGWRESSCSCAKTTAPRSEEHTSELQSRFDLVWRLLLEKTNSPNTRCFGRPSAPRWT